MIDKALPAQPRPEPITLAKVDDTKKLCGNCEFGVPNPQQLNLVTCTGVPPYPIGIPQQMPNGQVAMNIQFVNPPKGVNDKRCALWEKRAPMLDLGTFIKRE